MGHFDLSTAELQDSILYIFGGFLGLMILFMIFQVFVNGLYFLAQGSHLRATVKKFHQGLSRCRDKDEFLEYVRSFFPPSEWANFDVGGIIQRLHDIYLGHDRSPDVPRFRNQLQELRKKKAEYFSRYNTLIMIFNIIAADGILGALWGANGYRIDDGIIWVAVIVFVLPYGLYLFREYLSNRVVDEIDRMADVYGEYFDG